MQNVTLLKVTDCCGAETVLAIHATKEAADLAAERCNMNPTDGDLAAGNVYSAETWAITSG